MFSIRLRPGEYAHAEYGLNPLLSEAVFSIAVYRLRHGEYAARLNPLLSEAVFSIRRKGDAKGSKGGSLNPLLSEAVFSIGVIWKRSLS